MAEPLFFILGFLITLVTLHLLQPHIASVITLVTLHLLQLSPTALGGYKTQDKATAD